jgi:hypothetical protein
MTGPGRKIARTGAERCPPRERQEADVDGNAPTWGALERDERFGQMGRQGSRGCARSAPSPRAADIPPIRCFAHTGQREMMMSRRPPWRSVLGRPFPFA